MSIFKRKTKNQKGYVALEFAVAMGFLVLPTMMLVLQLPAYLEKRDRIDAMVSTIAQNCANDANSTTEANTIAINTATKEMAASTTFKKATLVSSRCVFESGKVQANTKVTAYVDMGVPNILLPGIPGLNGKGVWTYHAQHSVIVPAYRSFEE